MTESRSISVVDSAISSFGYPYPMRFGGWCSCSVEDVETSFGTRWSRVCEENQVRSSGVPRGAVGSSIVKILK